MTYFAPESISDVLAAMAVDPERSVVLGGGTIVEPMITSGELSGYSVIGLWRAGLGAVECRGGETTFGATVRLSEVAAEMSVPALAEAAKLVGGPAVRNRATIGGNVATGRGDLLVPLLALDAHLTVSGSAGTEERALIDVLTDARARTAEPAPDPDRAIEWTGRLLTRITVPKPKGRSAYVKIGRRRYNTPSVAAACAVGTFGRDGEEGVVTTMRVAIQGPSRFAQRAVHVEELLVGQPLTETAIDNAVDLLTELGDSYDDAVSSAWYRVRMSRVALRRALLALKGGEPR